MRNWEDIIKDKMEEVEGALPEGAFAEFQARRSGASPSSTPKRSPLLWAMVPAVAAGLAAVLFLLPVQMPEDSIQIVEVADNAITRVSDSLIVPTAGPAAVKHPVVGSNRDSSTGSKQIDEPVEKTPVSSPVTGNYESAEPDEEIDVDPEVPVSSPVIPEQKSSKPVTIKIVPATGIIAGGGLIAALTASLIRSNADADINYLNHLYDMGDTQHSQVYAHSPNASEPPAPKDVLTGEAVHGFPVRVGLSVGIPLSERLKVTTGVDYSRFASKFTYSLSGEKTQVAHYVGIPVRLDWAFVSRKRFGAYVGAGFEGDICAAATFAGEKIKKDGFVFSLVGAGGVQFNLTKRVGLYVEPQLSWAVPSERRVLETYRSNNPLMFSTTGGIRFNLGR